MEDNKDQEDYERAMAELTAEAEAEAMEEKLIPTRIEVGGMTVGLEYKNGKIVYFGSYNILDEAAKVLFDIVKETIEKHIHKYVLECLPKEEKPKLGDEHANGFNACLKEIKDKL